MPQRLLLVAALALAISLAAACGGDDNGEPDHTDRPRTPEDAALRWLELWGQDEFEQMWDMVATEAQATTDKETFISRYQAIKEEATITGFDFKLDETSTDPTATDILGGDEAPPEGAIEVGVNVVFKTEFFGEIPDANRLPFIRETVTLPAATAGDAPVERDEWRVLWSPSLYFSQLDDESLINFFPRAPRRGTIYDRNGQTLALDANLPVVGFVVDYLTDREAAIAALASGLGASDGEIRAIFDQAAAQPTYYFTPVRTLPYTSTDADVQKFRDMVDLGIVVREDTQRFYPFEDAAAHVIGYMNEITEEQLALPEYEGYESGNMIGAAGLEAQYQDTLAGVRGGLLAAVSPEGVITTTIAETPSEPGKDIWLTIDVNVQKQAEAQLGDKVGAVVVMDPRDNSVVAMASYPRFNPNSFIRGLTDEEATNLFNNPDLPFLNRALLAEYPPGSTFKPVTMAAGIETTEYTTGSTFNCVPVWTGLGEDFPQKNWQTVGRGYLTPAEGLMASCNPVFFDLAKRMDEIDENIFPEFIRQFGYGAETGIGIEEASGNVPDPDWKLENVGEYWFRGDAVNMAIGQGYVTATPMQIANVYSAIAGSGVLKKPLLIWRVGEPSAGGGVAVQENQAEEVRPLPVAQETLDSIRYGLYLVTQSSGGTSYQAWLGTSLDVAGKSGTAEDLAEGSDHVFFAAYANRSAPSLVALGVLEEGESGSAQVAPMLRNVLEAHVGLPTLGQPAE